MNKILVTGANGFIGSKVCEKLNLKNYFVIEVIRNNLTLNKIEKKKIAQVKNIDKNTDWLEILNDIDCIIHCAGIAQVLSNKDSNVIHDYRKINTEGTRALAEQAVKAGVKRLIFLSSIKVNGEKNLNHKKPFRHDDLSCPIDPYAISKWEAEKYLHEISKEHGLEIVIIRPPLVYGPEVKGNFLRLIKLSSNKIPLPFSKIKNLRSFIGLDNLADFIIHCINHPAAPGKVFLVSDGEDISTPDLIKKISFIMGKSKLFLDIPVFILKLIFFIFGRSKEFESLTGSMRVDTSNAFKVLGWKPKNDLDYGLRKTIKWYLNKK